MDSFGSILDASAPIKRARLQNGDALTLHVSRATLQACREAFATILGDGSVVTWGTPECGCNSRAVQDQLKNVQQIQASGTAFAAIDGDGQQCLAGSAQEHAADPSLSSGFCCNS